MKKLILMTCLSSSLLSATDDKFIEFITTRIEQTEKAAKDCENFEYDYLMSWYYAGKIHAFYEALYWQEMSGRPILE